MSVDKIRTQIAMTGPATYEIESSWWKRLGVINASETEYFCHHFPTFCSGARSCHLYTNNTTKVSGTTHVSKGCRIRSKIISKR